MITDSFETSSSLDNFIHINNNIITNDIENDAINNIFKNYNSTINDDDNNNKQQRLTFPTLRQASSRILMMP